MIRQLGSGGMGAVYLVRHPRLPRSDALKLLRPELVADPDFAERFLREADLAARLSHRNIVPVLDRGEDDGRLWLTMQYVDGVDAERALTMSGGLFPAERAVRVVSAVAAALDHAHTRHLLHRDVKPANVLLAPGPDEDEPESVFLTDFGIAKALDGGTGLTRTGAVVATLDYASPEQIECRPLDARSDIYSLGCLLYRLVTGSVPYPGSTVAAAFHGHLTQPPPRPSALVPWLPPALDDVVARAMAKDPDERFASCRDLAAAARTALADFPAVPDPPYSITLIPGLGGTGAVVGPIRTEALPPHEAEHLVDLIRRMRFFALPEMLPAGNGQTWGAPTTIEVACSAVTRRVAFDLAAARRPPELDDLVDAVMTSAPETGGDEPERPPTEQGGPTGPTTPHEPDRGRRPTRGRHPLLVPGAVVMAIAAVVVLATVLLGGFRSPDPDPRAGSPTSAPTTPAAPTPAPTTRAPTTPAPPAAPGLADLDTVEPVVLEAPPFDREPPSLSDAAGLAVVSQEPNQITDVDAWLRANQLSLPGDLEPVGAPADPAPAGVPTTYRGRPLARVLDLPEATFLLYGERAAPSVLVALDPTNEEVRYAYDFQRFVMAPEFAEGEQPYVAQGIRWAREVDGVLYVSHAHRTYSASSAGMNAYITAIDLTSGQRLWRSPPLVANSENFEILQDRIVTGYGFTSEPDWLYVLDRGTGAPTGALELASAPEYLVAKDGSLFVRCYDVDYVIRP
ncbi:serine/threonine protein kinase [Geodermatophilus sp. YIM 151500]|uniref:serine/threonine-protein kinase n=1 Tax=Geodermatophilus sp. YIM 151500 TaxID=2984531 RepID=UPI0021E401D4|nr:serine/threonine-protein kinase [Geodermatophilus sp. YIM 151500]MCV2489931.1 serine/threonine protein kinase [Geodermatophilus sp. YIM 151500]